MWARLLPYSPERAESVNSEVSEVGRLCSSLSLNFRLGISDKGRVGMGVVTSASSEKVSSVSTDCPVAADNIE